MIAAHGPGGTPGAWDLDPVVLTAAIAAIVLYVAGARRLVARGSPRAPSRPRQSAFFAGVVAALAAVVSPLHGWSETLFSAHMGQHLVLMVVAAPLAVIGHPAAPFLAALPADLARAWGRIRSAPRRHAPLLLHPLAIWLVSAVVLWAWHLPTLYDAALDNEAVHALEHATFILTAGLVWAAAFGERPIGPAASVVLLLATALQSAALGAILTFAGSVLYDAHALAAPAVGIDPLTDQQLAGVIMWIPAGIVYLAAMAVMLARLLRITPARPVGEGGRP